MTIVIETVLIAAVPGMFEGLLAIAIVLTYRASGVVNVALGSAGALGAVVAAALAPALTPVPALLLGVCVSAVCGAWLTDVACYRPLRPYPRSLLVTALAGAVLSFILAETWHTGFTFPALLPERLVGVGPYQVTSLLIVGLGAGLLVTGASAALLHVRPPRAAAPGLRSESAPATWVALGAGAIAGVAACLTAEATFEAGFMLIPGLVAVLAAAVARLRSPVIAFAAAIAVEVTRALSIHDKMPHSGYTLAFVTVLLVAAGLYALHNATRLIAGMLSGAGRRQPHY
jgi:branched-subunit amino acid ABC-type transport system permease component